MNILQENRRTENGWEIDSDRGPKRVAIVHDWLPEIGGAERVLEQMLRVFPGAEIFTLVDFIPPSERSFLQSHKVTTSFLQNMPGAQKHYRAYLPLMPLAVEHFDLSEFDLIISSSYAVAKGVITGPDQLHLCYCHSPIRYAWDFQEQYLRQTHNHKGIRGFCARALLHYIRIWDSRTPNGVDSFAANSHFIQRRIRKTYRRRSRVIYPPVSVEASESARGGAMEREDFYLSVGRLVPYKRVDILIDAFRRFLPGKRLVVIGDGPERETLSAGLPPNVQLLGRQPRAVVLEHLRRARAVLFAAEEDFGIVPVEAQACGTPVVAFGKGGSCETVLHGRTGILFEQQTAESLAKGIREAAQIEFDSEMIQSHADSFGVERFESEFRGWVESEWHRFRCVKQWAL